MTPGSNQVPYLLFHDSTEKVQNMMECCISRKRLVALARQGWWSGKGGLVQCQEGMCLNIGFDELVIKVRTCT